MNNLEVEAHHKKMKEGIKNILEEEGGNIPEQCPTVAIGYLDSSEPYEKGDVPFGFIKKLRALWDHGLVLNSLGFHVCSFGKRTRKSFKSSEEKILRDKVNKIEYVFPEMIFHYIKAHKFKPKEEFIEFVMRDLK